MLSIEILAKEILKNIEFFTSDIGYYYDDKLFRFFRPSISFSQRQDIITVMLWSGKDGASISISLNRSYLVEYDTYNPRCNGEGIASLLNHILRYDFKRSNRYHHLPSSDHDEVTELINLYGP